MIRTFAYVTAVSFKNRMLLRVRRLRNPRYLASTLAGLAYLWFVFFRRMAANGHLHSRGLPTQFLSVGVDVAALVILVIMLFAWALPGDSGGLEFSEAEIQFLFPAPLTRRQLLSYKIFRAQPPLLISALAMTFLGFRQGKLVGVWISFVALSIYFTMTALGRARLRLAGIGFITRLVVVLGTLLLLSWFVSSRFDKRSLSGELSNLQRSPAGASSVATPSALQGGGLAAVLFVPRQMAMAVLPSSPAALATSAATVAAMAAFFFLVAARLNVSFEEASLAEAQRKSSRGDRRELRRSGTLVAFPRIPPPFQLRPGMRPEMAIFWKNLTAALRISSTLLVIVGGCAILAIAALVTTSNPSAHATVVFIALCFCAVFPLMGAGVFAQDLRLDLARIELLKSYPLSGEQLVAAEMAAPLLIVSLVELLLVGMTAVLLQLFGAPKGMAFAAQPEFIVVALLFAIPVCGAQLLLRNAFVVLFPAWVVRSKEEVKGFAVTGQRLLVAIANLILLAIVLLPAAVVLAPAYLIGQHYVHGPALLAIATVPAAALVVGEVLLGIRLLGNYFDGADLANEAGEVRA